VIYPKRSLLLKIQVVIFFWVIHNDQVEGIIFFLSFYRLTGMVKTGAGCSCAVDAIRSFQRVLRTRNISLVV